MPSLVGSEMCIRDRTATVEFQPTVTAIFGQGSSENILAEASGWTGEVGGSAPTLTPTPTPTLSTTPSLTPSPTVTPLPTATITPIPTETITPTPTKEVGGPDLTLTPSPTPTPNSFSSTTPVELTSHSNGETVYTTRPTFYGTAAPYAQIKIVIESPTVLTATVYADENGNWSFTPDTDLEEGSHTVTITAVDSQGNVTTTTASIVIASGKGETEELPVSGVITPTVLLFLLGLFSLGFGGFFMLH